MSAPRFHTLQVEHVRAVSEQAVAVRFTVPAHLQADYAFTAGQYVTIRHTVDGEDIRRAYSICSAVQHVPDSGDVNGSTDHSSVSSFEVGIKAVHDGRFSRFAQQLTAADKLDVMTPQGRFVVHVGGRHNYLLFAAGSGITPCLSIAASVLEFEANSLITLVYNNRTTADTMFKAELSNLKDLYPDRLMLVFLMSREQQDVAMLHARLDKASLQLLVAHGLIDPVNADGIYMCGPTSMTTELIEQLRADGVTEGAIHVELFSTDNKTVDSSGNQARIAKVSGNGVTENDVHMHNNVQNTEGGVSVKLTLDGVQHTINVHPESETVLSAAQRYGLDIPYSCAGGMCCTCRCKVVSGKASMDNNYSLQKWEIEAGFTLACQSRPDTEELVLDFDAT